MEERRRPGLRDFTAAVRKGKPYPLTVSNSYRMTQWVTSSYACPVADKIQNANPLAIGGQVPPPVRSNAAETGVIYVHLRLQESPLAAIDQSFCSDERYCGCRTRQSTLDHGDSTSKSNEEFGFSIRLSKHQDTLISRCLPSAVSKRACGQLGDTESMATVLDTNPTVRYVKSLDAAYKTEVQ